MIVWVMYDIKDNKRRRDAAKVCLQSGIYRVQYSVFLGTLTRSDKDTLALQLEEITDPDEDSVYIFPMSRKELRQTILLGQAFDKDMVTDEVRQLFI